MHKLDIAVGLLYLPVCFVIGYTTANLKLCQMLCTHPPPPPPPKEEQWRDGVGVENYVTSGSGSGCGVWGVGTLHVFLRQSIDKPTLFKTKRSYELWKIDFTEPHLVYLHRIFSVFG